MKEQSLGWPVYLLGYPIALAAMIVFYVTEVLHAGLRMMVSTVSPTRNCR